VDRKIVVACALLIGSVRPVIAQTAVPPLPVGEDPSDLQNKKVCKSEASTGSRFQKRVCHTNREWDQIREQNMRDMSEMSRPQFGSDSTNPNTPN
jgi:hypothetical protein